MNKVIVAGRIVKGAELRVLPSGKAVAKTTVAVNERYRNQKGDWQERVNYLDVETFGSLAERLTKLGKGDKVLIEGKLRQDIFERNGEKREKIKIIANRIQLIAKPKSTNQNTKKEKTENIDIDIEDII